MRGLRTRISAVNRGLMADITAATVLCASHRHAVRVSLAVTIRRAGACVRAPPVHLTVTIRQECILFDIV